VVEQQKCCHDAGTTQGDKQVDKATAEGRLVGADGGHQGGADHVDEGACGNGSHVEREVSHMLTEVESQQYAHQRNQSGEEVVEQCFLFAETRVNQDGEVAKLNRYLVHYHRQRGGNTGSRAEHECRADDDTVHEVFEGITHENHETDGLDGVCIMLAYRVQEQVDGEESEKSADDHRCNDMQTDA